MFYYSLNDKEKIEKHPIEWKNQSFDIHAKTYFSAISPGTEMAAYLGHPPLRPMTLYPRLMGYCNLAKTEKTNKFILTFQSHRSDFRCHNDDIMMEFDGNLNREQQIHASTLYLYHLGFDAITKAKKHKLHAKNIAIIGYGTLGLGCALVAKAMGLSSTIFTSQDIENSNHAIPIINKETDSLNKAEFDCVVNTSNQWDDHFLALKLANRYAPIVTIGFPGRGQNPPNFNPLASEYLYDKQLAILSCGDCPIDDIKTNLNWIWNAMQDGRIDPNIMISGVIPADELNSAYQQLKSRQPETFTYVLDWTMP
jgi:hypothetical protein